MNFYQVTLSSLQDIWEKFLLALPNIIAAIIVFLIGILVAVILERAVEKIFKVLVIDKTLSKLGIEKAAKKAGVRVNSGRLVGGLVKWFIIIVFLWAAVDILNLAGVSEFLKGIALYIPNIVAAVLILIAGAIIAYFVERTVTTSLRAASKEHYVFVSGVAKWAVLIFAILAALNQLGIAPEIIQTLFMGIVVMLAIAGGLAFGLGGKDLAHEILEKVKRDFKK